MAIKHILSFLVVFSLILVSFDITFPLDLQSLFNSLSFARLDVSWLFMCALDWDYIDAVWVKYSLPGVVLAVGASDVFFQQATHGSLKVVVQCNW